jgi:hypothetical protein
MTLVKSAAASLVNHLDDITPNGFMSLLNAKCVALGLNFVVSDMSVTQQPAFTVPPAAASGGSSGTVVLVVVIVIIALVVLAGTFLVCKKEHAPTDNISIYSDGKGNEMLADKGVPAMGLAVDDKTVQI